MPDCVRQPVSGNAPVYGQATTQILVIQACLDSNFSPLAAACLSLLACRFDPFRVFSSLHFLIEPLASDDRRSAAQSSYRLKSEKTADDNNINNDKKQPTAE
ncbi:hypothetical protein BCV70DRAFT_202698 [Testicularia cyperi]|uniref:Uncharacterized protein n=1 Tax=Testicularia cyperi TaxID=1882483 RepID=A0A317XHB9_9BASI|nr:hypothetical protein BCV70DRAFT_202698 [Testicularia cyperi]